MCVLASTFAANITTQTAAQRPLAFLGSVTLQTSLAIWESSNLFVLLCTVRTPFLYDSRIPPTAIPSCPNLLAISRLSRGLRREARKIRPIYRPPRTEPYCIVPYRISRYPALHQSLTRFVQKYRGEGEVAYLSTPITPVDVQPSQSAGHVLRVQ